MMLESVLRELNNWFQLRDACLKGPFEISGGSLPLSSLPDGQFVRICGSVFNDGLHSVEGGAVTGLVDETFGGCVWPLAIPPAVQDLAEKAQEYETAHADEERALKSESFGGYSYSKRDTLTGAPWTWRDEYRAELDVWRKL